MWTFANCAFLVICLSWCCNQCETTFMIKAWFLFWMKNLFSDAGDRTMSGTSKASLWPLQHSATQNNLFKMGQPRPLFRLFLVLSNNQYNFYNNQCEKCSSSIRRRDLNPQLLKHELSPITTWAGHPPIQKQSLWEPWSSGYCWRLEM